MPVEEKNVEATIEKIEDIPLYLIPKAIADQIKKKGHSVFQILVTKKFKHRYTVKIETSDEYAKRMQEEDPAREEGDGHG